MPQLLNRITAVAGRLHSRKSAVIWTIFLAAGSLWAGAPPTAQLASASTSQWYVSPQGAGSNAGTIDAPMDLASALSASSPARPGDTIWMRGGVYLGTFTSFLIGTEAAPIIVRQYPEERAIIDSRPGTASSISALYVKGAHTWFWGFEVRSSEPNRIASSPSGTGIRRGAGVTSHAPGAKFINLVVHDMRIGIEVWSSSPDSETYGNLIYHNGYAASDRGHGHSIYAQNRYGTQRFTDNIMFGGFSHGFHAYGSDAAYLNNMQLEGNTIFNSGVLSPYFDRNILLGGGRKAEQPVVKNNYTYYSAERRGGENNLGYEAGCANLIAEGNYWAHPAQYPLVMKTNCAGVLQNNLMIGFVSNEAKARWAQNTFPGTSPTGLKAFVRRNRYEAGRANITVYNWDKAPAVDINMAGIGLNTGDTFEVRDVQDYFGVPAATGVYTGGPIRLPMNGTTVTRPIGNIPLIPAHTSAQFGAFIITKTGTTTPMADLVVSGSASPIAAVVNVPLTYTLSVTNRGAAPANGVSLESVLPSTAQWISRATSQGTCPAGMGACALGTIAAGGSATVTLSVKPTVAGSLTHSVSVQSQGADANAADNRADIVVQVQAPAVETKADLTVSELVTPSSAVAGADLSDSVTVRNDGQKEATGVVLRLAVRGEPAAMLRSVTAGSTSCQPENPTTFSCALGTLAPGATRTFGWTIRTATGAAGTIVTTSSATTAAPEVQVTNNIVTTRTQVAATPATPPPPPPASPPSGPGDVAVTYTLSYANTASGRSILLRLTVKNAGTAAQAAVRLTNMVRAQPWVINSVRGTSSQGSCSGAYPVTCTLGSLAAGASATVDITLLPRLSNTFTSEVRVTGSLAEATPADNVLKLTAPTFVP